MTARWKNWRLIWAGSGRYSKRNLGYENNNEIMSMSTLGLPVLPGTEADRLRSLDVRTRNRFPSLSEYIE